jgi:hypothetical protein
MGYALRLLKTHDIVVKRPQEGYFENMEWVEPKLPLEMPIKCNIQPFSMSQKRFVLPEGMRVEYCVIVRSQDIEFRTTNSWKSVGADTFEYKGYEYECYQDQDWNGYGLSTDHSACLAVRKDVARDMGVS